jgi:hypothetical protein
VKDKLAAEPGGVGKPEASYHQQQATEAVHNTIFAQLQATGRNPASTSLLVHVPSMSCYWISPQFGKDMLCQTHHWESWLKASVCTSLANLKDQNFTVMLVLGTCPIGHAPQTHKACKHHQISNQWAHK